jgi:hypothetical protein
MPPSPPIGAVVKFPRKKRMKPRKAAARRRPMPRTKNSPAAIWLTGLRLVLGAAVQLLAAATLLRLCGW